MVSTRHSALTAAKKTHLNRKKTIRRRHQAGRITDEERDRLMERALRDHRGETARTAQQRAAIEAARWGRMEDCHPECVAAQGLVCSCPCLGANHGSAWGTPPESVRGQGPHARQARLEGRL